MGAGTGFERGAHSISNSVMAGVQLGLQQQRYDQLDERYNKMFDWKEDFKRGESMLPPAYTEEEQAAQAAATRPEIPSSTPTVTPGPLGVPQTTFPVGKPVQPMPAAQPAPSAGGAMGLIPLGMRPTIGRNPSLSMSSRLGFGRTR